MIKQFLQRIISPLCICSRCPSYPRKDPKLYCERAKSQKKINKKGCVCGQCFVWKFNRFSGYYYCVKGKDKKSKL